MSYPILQLKTGKEASLGFHHPWIFSGALEKTGPMPEHGACVHVADRNGRVIGTGTYSNAGSIAVRAFLFGQGAIDRTLLTRRIKEAHERRILQGYGPGTQTTGYRCVFGEADGIPGLVVDRYADVIVFQIATAGLDRLRGDVVAALTEALKPTCLVERSDAPIRKEENLEPVVMVHIGEEPGMVEFLEMGRRSIADVMHGQKTGFFLDQKELRTALGALAHGRDVLNLFSYSGAAGVAAMQGGAKSVHHVDGSEEALALVNEHARLNGLEADAFTTEQADMFQWLALTRPLTKGEIELARETQVTPSFGMVIIDPPALIKSHKDIEEGKKAYHFLNRAAMRLVRDNGIFVTSSCSHFMTEDDLAFILRRASVQAGVELQVLRTVRQSPDHPLSVYFPESAYLKSFICRVKKIS